MFLLEGKPHTLLFNTFMIDLSKSFLGRSTLPFRGVLGRIQSPSTGSSPPSSLSPIWDFLLIPLAFTLSPNVQWRCSYYSRYFEHCACLWNASTSWHSKSSKTRYVFIDRKWLARVIVFVLYTDSLIFFFFFEGVMWGHVVNISERIKFCIYWNFFWKSVPSQVEQYLTLGVACVAFNQWDSEDAEHHIFLFFQKVLLACAYA